LARVTLAAEASWDVVEAIDRIVAVAVDGR
jgi:hypothetical protein